MIFRIDFQTFVTMMAVAVIAAPSTLHAFNIPSKRSSVSSTQPSSTIPIPEGQLQAALVESTVEANGGELEDYANAANAEHDGGGAPMLLWSSMMDVIQANIDDAEEANNGKSLSDKAKEDIIAKAVAYKARHVLEQAGQAALAHANLAMEFTKKELGNEPDFAQVSNKILVALQDKATTVHDDLPSPTALAAGLKDTALHMIESEDLQTLPTRSFQAVRQFLESDEVKTVSSKALQAIQEGWDSDAVKALQSRAAQSLKDTIQTTTTSKK